MLRKPVRLTGFSMKYKVALKWANQIWKSSDFVVAENINQISKSSDFVVAENINFLEDFYEKKS